MIEGRTVLDVGCGVGLASLTAAAIKVREGSEQHFVSNVLLFYYFIMSLKKLKLRLHYLRKISKLSDLES